jgi:ATP phosphoribosyltransferase regulatory subunit
VESPSTIPADRIPSGTRDVLPDEMRELRALTARIREVFAAGGYEEVSTPALEFESTFSRVNLAANAPAYRLFDESGAVLVLRPDMTVPIARLVATRYPQEEPPLRFCYEAPAWRGVRPQRGQSREFLQMGVELIGVPGPAGTAEVLTVLCAALDATGLDSYRVGLDAELLLRLARTRGGPEVLDGLSGALHDALGGMRAVHARLAPAVADRIIFDLGLVRSLGYYTGAVFQVYDPAYGRPIGGGGRYDDLLGLFGRPLPAVGFALNVERLHIALTGEEGRGRG